MNKLVFYVCLFAVAMGFMESAIVIYLREIFYPAGFHFPLAPIPRRLAAVEILREAATVVMLVCIGFFAGKNKLQRFAFFCVAFAVWDLCYYIFLFVFIGWPQSLFTWDILFLIPMPWVGPVWAPCLLSALMLAGALFIIRQIEKNKNYLVGKTEWAALLTGALVCIVSFMLDFISATPSGIRDSLFSPDDLFSGVHAYVPRQFNNVVFFCGFVLMLATLLFNIFLTNKKTNHEKE